MGWSSNDPRPSPFQHPSLGQPPGGQSDRIDRLPLNGRGSGVDGRLLGCFDLFHYLFLSERLDWKCSGDARGGPVGA